MKILHITPHLGGGVGKAHATISLALPRHVERTFLLLEEPRDRRHADAIAATGGCVAVTSDLVRVATLAAAADIVQFEFWNHPRLFECLARCAFSPMRSVFWSHVSGLFRPVIQPGLIEQAARFVFTAEASRSIPAVALLPEAVQGKLSVINSGFGFTGGSRRAKPRGESPAIAYLGTVDFIKMHPWFFDAVDRLSGDDLHVSVWGAVDPLGKAAARARAMRHPARIHFGGQTADPATALSQADIFFYPLQPDHYGTAENALIEAMSLGLVPVVLNNPTEAAIIRHGETGFVARSLDECVDLLQMLLRSPQTRDSVSRNAARDVAETRTSAHSAREFMTLWEGLLREPPKPHDFRSVIGGDPANWFLATQCLPGETWSRPDGHNVEQPSKGMLAHFESVFPGDASLSRLARAAGRAPFLPS
jgi:glycosyltransferase involved in cell wall biosynthesis